jgi:acid-sensing ion channel, other
MKSSKMNLWKFFTDYSNNTTIQGVKYLGEENRHVAERVFWIISMIICAFCCTITIHQIYQNWDSNPVLMTFSEKSMSISQIPFPSVTICPFTKIKKNTLDFTEFCKKFKNNDTSQFTIEQMRQFEAAIHVCFYNTYPAYLENFTTYNLLRGENIINEIENVSIRLNDTMIICTMQLRHLPCRRIFKEVITELGICFTSNMIDFADILRQEK